VISLSSDDDLSAGATVTVMSLQYAVQQQCLEICLRSEQLCS